MSKKLTLAVLSILSATSAIANETKVKLSGGIDFQTAYYNHDGPNHEKFMSANHKHMAFNNSSHIGVDAKNKTDSDMTYGAKVGVATTARSARRVASGLYFESPYGKWELGSDKSAVAKMKITPYKNACGTGAWDYWIKSSYKHKDQQPTYMLNFGGFVDQKTRKAPESEFSRKITYYTPLWNGLQFGVSYIPDTSNAGYAQYKDAERHDPTKVKGYKIDIKDAVAVGATYSGDITDDLNVKLALVFEHGKAVPVAVSKKDGKDVFSSTDTKFSNLKTYAIGTEIKYGRASLVWAYQNFMKSLTSKDVDINGRNTHMYGFGGRYDFTDEFSSSITHFSSNNKGNRVNATTVAAEYKFVKGVLPYAEITAFKTRGKFRLDGTGPLTSDKAKGTLFVMGVKVEF